MTPIKPSQKIRKVWLPNEMKTAMQELCWQNRTKPSPYIAGLIQSIVDEPSVCEGMAVPPAGLDYASVYVTDEVWYQGVEVATAYGTKLSAMVRALIARDLAEEGIPWDVTTARPRNEHIPKME